MSVPGTSDRKKMLYQLEPDEDGYPPASVEGLWVRPSTSGGVVLDNIPFFARGIAPGDELSVTVNADGETWFQALVRPSGASVFRIHADSDQEMEKIREELLSLGLPSEVDRDARLIAMEIPVGAAIEPALNYLVFGQESGRFDFEEGVLRHALPD